MATAYDLLLERIDGFIRKYYLNQLVRASIYLAGVFLISFLAFISLEYFGYFSTPVRAAFLYGFVLINAGFFAARVLPPLLHFLKLGRYISHEQASEIIGTHFGDVKDKLLNVLQLRRQPAEQAQRLLIEASIAQKINTLEPVPFSSAIRLRNNRRYLGWAVVPLLITLALALAIPALIREGTSRLIHYRTHFEPQAPFRFGVNKNLSVTQGDDFTLEVRLSGNEFPAELFLSDGQNTFRLERRSNAFFSHVFRNVQENIDFQLIGNEFRSSAFMLHVKRKPEILRSSVQLNFPAYIRRKNQQLDHFSDLRIPAGTRVDWTIQAKNTQEIDASAPLIRQKNTGENSFPFSGQFLKSTTVRFLPRNRESGRSDSAVYAVSVIPDLPPSISVGEKKDSVRMNARYFSGEIDDDYGFSRLEFHYTVKKEGSADKKEHIRKIALPGDRRFFYYLDVKSLEANPGDEVEYFFDIWDNDGVNGAKKARSAVFMLEIPTRPASSRQLDKDAQATQQQMQAAARLSREIDEEIKKLSLNLLNKSELSFDEKKQIENLLKKKEELEKQMADIQKQNERNRERRKELDPENKQMQEKQQQLDDLFNKTLNKETQELLKKIQKLLEQNAPEQTQEQLGKMQSDNKSMQKELDRMQELYKQLAFEQKLNEQVSELQKLADEQKQLAEKTQAKKADQSTLAKEQQKLNNEFSEVKKALDALKKQNDALERPNSFDPQQQKQDQVSKEMQQSREKLEKNRPEKAAENQQNAADQMQQMAGKMQEMEQQGMSQKMNLNINELRQLLHNLLNSSFEQEKVMQKLRTTSASDPGYTTLAQRQKNVQDNLKNVQDSLFSLSKRVPQIQSAVNKETGIINERMQAALNSLGERQTAEALRDQQYAMTSLNNLALMLNEALDQLQNMMRNAGSTGKSSRQSLSQMQKMQQQLNQNMQKAREQMQQEGNQGQSQKLGNQSQSEQFARMARQQQQIRETLQRMRQDEMKDGRGSGDLNNIQQQMEQTERELVNKQLTDEMIRRQNQIRVKLLEAENARREQDQDKDRESQAGKNTAPGLQKAWKEFEMEQKKQIDQLRTLTPHISPFYKSKINAYFELLNKSLP
ncbi:MAG: hypothetical protein INR69_04850 [Mucilaginibacter polytrichastri]|nr:hypothetical protein [Mucilaginibacter polytrichastri]